MLEEEVSWTFAVVWILNVLQPMLLLAVVETK
jgi:hypothetical protein